MDDAADWIAQHSEQQRHQMPLESEINLGVKPMMEDPPECKRRSSLGLTELPPRPSDIEASIPQPHTTGTVTSVLPDALDNQGQQGQVQVEKAPLTKRRSSLGLSQPSVRPSVVVVVVVVAVDDS